MKPRFIRVAVLISIVLWVAFAVLVFNTNRELTRDVQSYQQLIKDVEEETARVTEEKKRSEDKYARTLESWLEWQIQARVSGNATSIESIVLGKNNQGIAYITKDGSQKRYSFQFAFDRNNTALLVEMHPLQ